MPDPTKQTVSASQVPALFGESSYLSEWMLYQYFVNNADMAFEPNERMNWGNRLEGEILRAACEIEHIDAEFHIQKQPYVANKQARIGATLDYRFTHPQFGVVLLEAKNVDWLQWRDTWSDDVAAPRVELQVQAQMIATGIERGWIAALVGGNDLKLYPREANPKLQQSINDRVAEFFEKVENKQEPAVDGIPPECEVLKALYPEVQAGKIIKDFEMEHIVMAFEQAKEDWQFANKRYNELRTKLLAAGKDAEMLVAGAYAVEFKQSKRKEHTVKASTSTTLKVSLIER